MKKQKDWKLILNITSHHGVFINVGERGESLMTLYENIDEIKLINDVLILLPSTQEFENKDTTNYIKKLAPLLKSFIEDKSKKTIITEETVLNTLLKEDKRTSFFKFLVNNKKNIVVFCKTDYERYIKSIQPSYHYILMTSEGWGKNTEMFNRFKDIKIAIEKIYNPFKNPLVAFKKYAEEKS
ncbi:hypothetical protein GW796_07260 [archaeon]|nr:hypothetical protein [archaeon]NCQ51681.1 hypothetical protein [archaeon]